MSRFSMLSCFSDIDECSMDKQACDSTQNCVNTIGSYLCECRIGFNLDPVTGACTGNWFNQSVEVLVL